MRPDHDPTTGTPRWVKVFGIIAAVVVLLFLILMFTRGPGGRGPGGHTPFRHFGGQAPPSSLMDVGGPDGNALPARERA